MNQYKIIINVYTVKSLHEYNDLRGPGEGLRQDFLEINFLVVSDREE